MERKHYVYVFFRPNGTPCYIGKGLRGRMKLHFREGKGNPHLFNIIKSSGGNIPHLKIREGLTDSEACEIERALITAVGRECDGGPLVNLTLGGDGMAGYKQPDSHRNAIADALRGKPKSPEHAKAAAAARVNRGKGIKRGPPSEATRKAIGDGHRGIPMKEEHRLAMLGKKYSLERCAAISAALIGRKTPREVVEKQRASNLERHRKRRAHKAADFWFQYA